MTYPEKLMLRDTALHDDLGGLGQPIFTTAGQGYTKVEYVRGDIVETLRQQLTAERAISDKLEKVLTGVQSEFYQYTEGFDILWDEIDSALAEVTAMRKGETE